MNEAIRERLGQAAYEARCKHLQSIESSPLDAPPWERMPDVRREFYRREAEAAVLSFAELFMPAIRNMLSEDEIKRLLKTLE